MEVSLSVVVLPQRATKLMVVCYRKKKDLDQNRCVEATLFCFKCIQSYILSPTADGQDSPDLVVEIRIIISVIFYHETWHSRILPISSLETDYFGKVRWKIVESSCAIIEAAVHNSQRLVSYIVPTVVRFPIRSSWDGPCKRISTWIQRYSIKHRQILEALVMTNYSIISQWSHRGWMLTRWLYSNEHALASLHLPPLDLRLRDHRKKMLQTFALCDPDPFHHDHHVSLISFSFLHLPCPLTPHR